MTTIPQVPHLEQLLGAFEADREAFARVTALLDAQGKRLDDQRAFIESTRRELEILQGNGDKVLNELKEAQARLQASDGERWQAIETTAQAQLASYRQQVEDALRQATVRVEAAAGEAEGRFKWLKTSLQEQHDDFTRTVRNDVDGMRGVVATQGQQLNDLAGGFYQSALPLMKRLEDTVDTLKRELTEEHRQREVLTKRLQRQGWLIWLIGPLAAGTGAILAIFLSIAFKL